MLTTAGTISEFMLTTAGTIDWSSPIIELKFLILRTSILIIIGFSIIACKGGIFKIRIDGNSAVFIDDNKDGLGDRIRYPFWVGVGALIKSMFILLLSNLLPPSFVYSTDIWFPEIALVKYITNIIYSSFPIS